MSNDSRSVSPWWWLLLLPVAPLAGWGLGQLSGPTPPPPKAVAGQYGTAAGVRSRSPAAGAAERPSREAPREEYSQWTTLENAVAESQRNGKPVLIDFSADWCGPCQRLKREVFDNGTHAQVVQTTVIPVSIVDRVRERGSNPPDIENLQRRYQVDAFPTLVVFSPRTGQSRKTRGVGDAQWTLAWITEAAKAVR